MLTLLGIFFLNKQFLLYPTSCNYYLSIDTFLICEQQVIVEAISTSKPLIPSFFTYNNSKEVRLIT
jgi:hypothetical protein